MTARDPDILVSAKGVGLTYPLHNRHKSTKDLFMGRLFRGEKMWALRNVSFELRHGEVLGVVGRNGAGKSSLCRVLCGIHPPDEGEVETQGRVSAVLGLGDGMSPDLSGRANIALGAAFMGLPRSEIKRLTAEVEDFTELGRHFDEPVRTYSSGMKARLGFAISTAVQPDVLILDEHVRVGDIAFRRKAEDRMRELREQSKSMVLISHAMDYLRRLCTKGIWLEKGVMMKTGPIGEVIDAYLEASDPKAKQAVLSNAAQPNAAQPDAPQSAPSKEQNEPSAASQAAPESGPRAGSA